MLQNRNQGPSSLRNLAEAVARLQSNGQNNEPYWAGKRRRNHEDMEEVGIERNLRLQTGWYAVWYTAEPQRLYEATFVSALAIS